MKKRYSILLTVLLTGSLFSCTPQHLKDDGTTIQQTDGCCGEDGGLDLPPPPPPIEGKAL
ncbi:hypothetical protein ES677_03630 [Bizionia gelidisalsuginis]|uniref:Lipoprotein n=2 Tax=Bizionia TaxID=283785 RepID=A0A8H2QJF4_9FLAO|nr:MULTISPECIES: hypothetical protein [Bizionia]TYB74479.1 hypothetical protein ES676_07320 [Bizionia saleffrena]TYC16274.1 hypothetical protein ES677_03630 [Bizionia gelidisalsuginis]